MRDINKYSFPHRVVNAWNGLEEDVVNAISVHKFKTELDISQEEETGYEFTPLPYTTTRYN